MTKFDASWAKAEAEKRKWMAENGMYSEDECSSSSVFHWFGANRARLD